MIFFILILLIVIIGSSEFCKKNEFNRDYISKDGTAPIKGIFVFLILMSHSKGYMQLSGTYDELYLAVQNHLNQMVVAMFFFYSGYGIMEQIKKRGFDYVKSIPLKRFPHLLMIFDIAVAMYMVMYVALGNRLTLKTALFALIGWQGVLNSSWYIFVTFALYILTFLSFLMIKRMKNDKLQIVCIILLTVLSLGLIVALAKLTDKESFWFNTLILYVLGFWYSYFKEYVEKILMKNDIIYYCAFAALLGAYVYFYLNRWGNFAFFEIWAVLFTLGIVMITMKVKINSAVLSRLGDRVFSVYILQRIPMVILNELGISKSHKYVYMILVIAITIAMAVIFDELTGRLTNKIWKPKKA